MTKTQPKFGIMETRKMENDHLYIKICIPTPPTLSKARNITIRKGKNGRPYPLMYNTKEYNDWTKLCEWYLCPQEITRINPIEKPILKVTATFHRKAYMTTRRHPSGKGVPKKWDSTNLEKAMNDMLTKSILWFEDENIFDFRMIKKHCNGDYTIVEIETFDDEHDPNKKQTLE